MFLFDANCVRQGPSVNVALSENDVALVRIDNIAGGPTTGLVTAAENDAGAFTLFPWSFGSGEAVAARTLWANSNGNFVRVIDPISLNNVDEFFTNAAVATNGSTGPNNGGWSPMRTAAAFFAPLETGSLHTTMYFVCPNTNIQRRPGSTGSAFNPSNGFPVIFPFLQLAGRDTPLNVRVYDTDETLLRDVTSACNCLTIKKVTDINPVYSSASEAPDGTYSEVEGGTTSAVAAQCSTTVVETLTTAGVRNSGNSCDCAVPTGGTFGSAAVPGTCTSQFQQTAAAVPGGGPFSFVAYRSITTPGFDVFNRIPGSSICHIQGSTGSCGQFGAIPTTNNTGGR
jgi:hypothetical protein